MVHKIVPLSIYLRTTDTVLYAYAVYPSYTYGNPNAHMWDQEMKTASLLNPV